MADKHVSLAYDDSIKANKKGEAILGRLTGPVADVFHSTRNGRQYPDALWERVFNSDIIKEYFESGGLLGELNHPGPNEERSETDLTKIAICMPERPIKDKNGKLIGSVDILDTPNGRIAATLAKYGYKLGISSRGEGDIVEDISGNQSVDPNTFELFGFDLVLLPAVKAARLQLVESTKQRNIKRALREALEVATDDERDIMKDTLSKLDIDIEEPKEEDLQDIAAENVGAKDLEELQEALKVNAALNEQIRSLQESLSVCHTKEARHKEIISTLRQELKHTDQIAQQLDQARVDNATLKESIAKKNQKIAEKQSHLKTLLEKVQSAHAENATLNKTNAQLVREFNKKSKLVESTSTQTQSQLTTLKAQLIEAKQDASLKESAYSKNLHRLEKISEQYKKQAAEAVNRYIESRATLLGITPTAIKNRLSEKYSYAEIDRICEDLQRMELNIAQLPFNLSKTSSIKAKVTENKQPRRTINSDDIDSSLLTLAGMED